MVFICIPTWRTQTEIIDLPSRIISTDIINDVYGGEAFAYPENILKLSNVAILAPNNNHCRKINENMFKLISGETRAYKSLNHLISENNSEVLQFPIEFLDSLELAGLSPYELNLKAGSVVILL